MTQRESKMAIGKYPACAARDDCFCAILNRAD